MKATLNNPLNNSMQAKHIKTGAVGERAVLNHLKRKGFIHLESNFKVKTGEIDLIVELDNTVHFVEVKTVSRENYWIESGDFPHGTYQGVVGSVSHETESGNVGAVSRGTSRWSSGKVARGTHRPEDNVHRDKLRKLLNTIQVWLSMNKYTGEWQLDVAAVYLDRVAKRASVRMIDNIIVE